MAKTQYVKIKKPKFNSRNNIIVNGFRDSSIQISWICDAITKFTSKKLSEKPWHVEGKHNCEWILLDYISVVAHVFYKENRESYDLEDLWADAIRTDIPNLN